MSARNHKRINANSLPLEGIRIVDFTTAWAGPACTMMLADMGAEVIKIENPHVPDASRGWPPFVGGKKEGLNSSGFFDFFNRGKKDCVLDLKNPENINAVKRLVAVSDVVIENYAPRVMESLGLSYETLKKSKPDVIMVSLSGYGAYGPERDCIAYGPVLEAYIGLSSLLTYPGGAPNQCGMVITDHIAAVSAAFVTLAALHHHNLTGEGQWVDISEVETAIACMAEAVMEYTMNNRVVRGNGNKDEVMAPHGCYRCKQENDWVAIAVNGDKEWQGLCRIMGVPRLSQDERFSDGFLRWQNQTELDEVVGKWARTQNSLEVANRLQTVNVAAVPVCNNENLYDNEHLKARKFYAAIENPETGTRELPGLFARLSRTPGRVGRKAPLFDEHTKWLLKKLVTPDSSR